jgi:hypothetical protein
VADFAIDHDEDFHSDDYAVQFMGNIADPLIQIEP